MSYNINTSRGTVRFHATSEPIVAIPARYEVLDTEGGWVCSRHKSFDLASKRATELNDRDGITAGRYKVQQSR